MRIYSLNDKGFNSILKSPGERYQNNVYRDIEKKETPLMDNQIHRAIIAANIQKYLQSRGIKQKDFAAKVGIVPSTLSDYLNMRITPSQSVIQKRENIKDNDREFKKNILDACFCNKNKH